MKKSTQSPQGALAILKEQGIKASQDGLRWRRELSISPKAWPDLKWVLDIPTPSGPMPMAIDSKPESAEAVISFFDKSEVQKSALSEMEKLGVELWTLASAMDPEAREAAAIHMNKTMKSALAINLLREAAVHALKGWRDEEHARMAARRLEERLRLSSYPDSFPLARSIGRQALIISGPTNSGKSHEGFSRLAKADSGAYLAPLRLLALEGQERIEALGRPCGLVTGEERQERAGSKHRSSTVEMAQFNEVVDCAVVDEAQMLADPDRGWAWSAAICGMPAKELIVVCAPEAVDLVKELLRRCGEEPQHLALERKQPLSCSRAPISLSELTAGDALVAFSRREVLAYRALLAKKGKKVAVVYGALAPEVRKAEAAKFASGEADILVATDAIGMGLNLPISRIVFSKVEKFDGESTRPLTHQEVLQISGRAGRYGVSASGVAATLDGSDSKWLSSQMERPREMLPLRASVSPNDSQITEIAAELKTRSLAACLRFFKEKMILQDDLFEPASMDSMLELARLADRRKSLDLLDKFAFCKAPLESKNPAHCQAWEEWMRKHESGAKVEPPLSPQGAGGFGLEDKLGGWEQAMKLLTCYLWLSWRLPSSFQQQEKALAGRGKMSMEVEKILAQLSAKDAQASGASGKLSKKKSWKSKR